MERVGTLLAKLQQQFAGKTSADELLITVQILQAELVHLTSSTSPCIEKNGVAIEISHLISGNIATKNRSIKADEQERVVEVLQVNEAEIEAELNELKQNARRFQKMSANNKPLFLFDMDEELPTLAQRENNSSYSSNTGYNALGSTAFWNNSGLQQEQEDEVTDTPIRDLKKGIAANDRFLYINELFRGDEAMYERSIKTINNFDILPEAEYWIQRELKVKIGWSENNAVVKQFNQLVKRRFS